MKKILFFIFAAIIITGNAHGAYKTKKITRTRLLDLLHQYNEFMIKGGADGAPISSIHYELMTLRVQGWLKDHYIELKTDLSREWLEQVATSLDEMRKRKLLLETATKRGMTHTDDYNANKTAFFNAYKDFSALLKAPKAPTPEEIEFLKSKLAEQNSGSAPAPAEKKK